jgi:hypothetical protein
LARDGRDLDLLRRPNLGDAGDNSYRRRLLEEHRAYERREGLFLDFPRRIDWFRAALNRDEVLDILFIDWDWWLDLSGGSRRPRDAARRIRDGDAAGVTSDEHEPFRGGTTNEPAAAGAHRRDHTGSLTTRPPRGSRALDRLRPLPRLPAAGARDPPWRLRRDREVVSVLIPSVS